MTRKTEQATSSASDLVDRFEGLKEVPAALVAGSKAYADGLLELGLTLGGFGREILVEASRHLDATLQARSVREVAELQAAFVQHRIEVSTAQAKEFADLALAKSESVIAPFAVLVRPKVS